MFIQALQLFQPSHIVSQGCPAVQPAKIFSPLHKTAGQADAEQTVTWL